MNTENWNVITERFNQLLNGEIEVENGEQFREILKEGFVLYTEEENKAPLFEKTYEPIDQEEADLSELLDTNNPDQWEIEDQAS
jgi:hypothetical protein